MNQLSLWDEYHGKIQSVIKECVDKYGWTHLFDVHGQSHREVMELGYMIRKESLRKGL